MRINSRQFNYDEKIPTNEISEELIAVMKLIVFIEEKAKSNPNKRNLYRRELLRDMLSGTPTNKLTEKYNIKGGKEPVSIYGKYLTRFCEYAGIDYPLTLRHLRKLYLNGFTKLIFTKTDTIKVSF